MSVVSSATVAVKDGVPLVFWSTSTMLNPEHETGLGDINGDLPEEDFWPGIICGLRSLSSILVPVGVPDPELSVTTFIPAFGSRSR